MFKTRLSELNRSSDKTQRPKELENTINELDFKRYPYNLTTLQNRAYTFRQ